MSTTVIIPTKNEIIGVKQILPKIDKNWAEEWLVIDGIEPKRIGGTAKMQSLPTGARLSLQIIKEFIFWKS